MTIFTYIPANYSISVISALHNIAAPFKTIKINGHMKAYKTESVAKRAVFLVVFVRQCVVIGLTHY